MTEAVTFDALVPEHDADAANTFLNAWFEGLDGWVVLTQIAASGPHSAPSMAMTVDRVRSKLPKEALESLTIRGGRNWNVYFSCSTHSEDPTEGSRSRGGKKTVSQVAGMWLDLDIKDEAFASAKAVGDFIRSLELRPTIVVDSGSGGHHVYYKFKEPVDREEGERLCESWWAYAQEKAGTTYIDKVTTCDRIMRLPGTVRWPKKAGEEPTQVRLLMCKLENMITPADVNRVAGDAWDRLVEQRIETKRYAESWKVNADELIAGATGWGGLLNIATVEDTFNDMYSWDEILRPFGWQELGQDHEGRRHWARPGQNAKSAHTDYPPSPHVMKLFSNAPDTGLARLNDAGVPLTKFQVYAALKYKGDIQALVSDTIAASQARIA